jgi:hypothetical protein
VAWGPSHTLATLVTVRAVPALVACFDRRLLADLAGTPDAELQFLHRTVWALVVVAFPIGPMLYLAYAKPRRP